MYAEFEVHRTMIRDRTRTEAFKRAIDSVVRPGDIVLDFGAGSGILSVLAARAGAARVYAVEQTTMAVLAQEVAAANGVDEIVHVIQGDVSDIEPPEQVDVIVSEWLGGFGIDEGMLVPLIAARDRWLKPGGIMIPKSVTAWAALVHDAYLEDMVDFLRDNPYGVDLEDLVEKTLNEIHYSGTFRHLAAADKRSQPGRLWTTDAELVTLEQAAAPHEAETQLRVQERGTANALALWFSAELVPGDLALGGTRRSANPLGNDDRPTELARRARARDDRERQSQDGAGQSGGDMDKLGDRPSRQSLGRARRTGDLGGDHGLGVSRPDFRIER